MDISRTTRLSALRELVRDEQQCANRENGLSRLSQSIQQSLAAEGYVYSEASVRNLVEQHRAK